MTKIEINPKIKEALASASGLTNWSTVPSNLAGGAAPELQFSWTPSFVDTSFVMSPQITIYLIESGFYLEFTHFVDWFADPCGPIGVGYTFDDGQNWTAIWQIIPEGNIGPENVYIQLYDLHESISDLRIGFFYSGDSFNIDFWYIDNLSIISALTTPDLSSFLYTKTDTTGLKVDLEWTPAWDPDPLTRYHIYRKEGLPNDTSKYINIADIGANFLSYEDYDVELNKTYTYKVDGFGTVYTTGSGNESTAYVPPVVPVELTSFLASVSSSNVLLNWMTVTETNNSGFEILRFDQNDNNGWNKIGFVPGYGSTTETRQYSFTDNNVKPGKYQYKLKQIDYGGSFEYSKIAEAEVPLPDKFSLSQNYPNPFNPVTTIKYSIPSVGTENLISVQLKVYDILGNEVATLVNEEQPAGEYEIEFEGSNLAGGVYLYRPQAGSFSETRKLILLK